MFVDVSHLVLNVCNYSPTKHQQDNNRPFECHWPVKSMKEKETLEMHVHLLYMCLTHSPTRGSTKCLMFSWENKWMALLLYTLLMCNYYSDENRAIIAALMRHISFALAHFWKALITMFNVTATAWALAVNAQRCLAALVQLEISHKCRDLFYSRNWMPVFYWWSNCCELYSADHVTLKTGVMVVENAHYHHRNELHNKISKYKTALFNCNNIWLYSLYIN